MYEYNNAVMGSNENYSGVPIHFSHWSGTMTDRIRQTGGMKMQAFLSGAPLRAWMKITLAWRHNGQIAQSSLKPCCQLKNIGGDGTAIGIPQNNLPKNMTAIHQPKTFAPHTDHGGRLQRCPLTLRDEIDPTDSTNKSSIKRLRVAIYEAASSVNDKLKNKNLAKKAGSRAHVLQQRQEQIRTLCVELDDWGHKYIAEPYTTEIRRWCGLNQNDDAEANLLRPLIVALSSQHEVRGLVNADLSNAIRDVLCATESEETSVSVLQTKQQLLMSEDMSMRFGSSGIGPEIRRLLLFQFGNNICQESTHRFLLQLVSDSKRVDDSIDSIDPSVLDEANTRGCFNDADDPSKCGHRYFMGMEPHNHRTKWNMPRTMHARNKQDQEVSVEGCHKQRFSWIGRRRRTALWVWTCMDHQHVVGFHVIPRAEGNRDAVFSLYRAKEAAPESLFVDFACSTEEVANNYLPVFFRNTKFYHDLFHGVVHKCSYRFCSGRMPLYAHFNTSIMEQVNSFLHKMDGMLLSGSSSVSNITSSHNIVALYSII